MSVAVNTELVPLDQLHEDPANARKGNVAAIAESLREFGQHRPVIARKDSHRIVAGNHLYRGAALLGWTEVAVWWVDDDDITAARRALADNAVGDLATWDNQALAELVQNTGPVPGLDEAAVTKLLGDIAAKQTDAEPEPLLPLTPQQSEEYEYVVIVARNQIDATWLRTRFDLRKEKSYKSDHVGVSHVMEATRVQELLG